MLIHKMLKDKALIQRETGIANLSYLVLTEDQISILSKGLTFCPTPGDPDMGELSSDLDKFHLRLKRRLFQ